MAVKTLRFVPSGVCAEEIYIEVEDNVIKKVDIIGGCDGNRVGVARLAEGMHLRDVIHRLEGIRCQNETSCPDQLAQALKTLLDDQSE